jgi:predicted small secreted protein
MRNGTAIRRSVVVVAAVTLLAGCGDTDSFGENACRVYDRIEADQSVLTDAQLVEQAQRMETLASESESVALQSAARAFAEDIVAGRDAAPASADVVAACNAVRG